MAGRFFTTEAPGKLKNNVVTEEMKGGQNELASHISKSTQYCFFNLKKKLNPISHKECAMR